MTSLGPSCLDLKRFARSLGSSEFGSYKEFFEEKEPPLVGCDRKRISRKAIKKAIPSLLKDREFFQSSTAIFKFEALATKHSEPMKWKVGRSLKNLLVATSDRGITQPHDKDFALLGLAEDDVSQELLVDNNQPYSKIYQKAMACVLKQGSYLISLVQAMNQRRSGFPSWYLDFSQANCNQYTNEVRWSPLSIYDEGASNTLPLSPFFHNQDEGTLEILGSMVGCIRYARESESSSTIGKEPSRSDWELLPKKERNDLIPKLSDCVIKDMALFTKKLRSGPSILVSVRLQCYKSSPREESGKP